MAINPPPPKPEITRPVIMTPLVAAKPQIRLPAANSKLLITKPVQRPYMSVNFPESGWHAAVAIMYAEATHASRLSELKLVEMGADRVAMMVVSRAPRNTPIKVIPTTRTSFVLPGSLAITVCSLFAFLKRGVSSSAA